MVRGGFICGMLVTDTFLWSAISAIDIRVYIHVATLYTQLIYMYVYTYVHGLLHNVCDAVGRAELIPASALVRERHRPCSAVVGACCMQLVFDWAFPWMQTSPAPNWRKLRVSPVRLHHARHTAYFVPATRCVVQYL